VSDKKKSRCKWAVKNQPTKTSRSEKYLGNVIISLGKIDANIQMRHYKGSGILNSIISILKEITFGQYHFETGMMLRTSMLVNGIHFSIETINSLSTIQIHLLEDDDREFMQRTEFIRS
jgi:hypothetical protein